MQPRTNHEKAMATGTAVAPISPAQRRLVALSKLITTRHMNIQMRVDQVFLAFGF
jgi:hypothetical protein